MTSQTVAEFLRSAGQVHLLEQVEQVETGFRITLDKLRASLHLGLQLLGHIATMTSMYPQTYKEGHRVPLYLKWMRKLSEDFKVDTCTHVVNEFNAKFVDVDSKVKSLQQHQIVNMNYQLENWSQDIHFRLQTIFQRMMGQGIENSKAVIDAGLLIQNEASSYILNHPGLSQALCYKQLLVNQQKIQDLEALITDNDNFANQMNGDILLLDELVAEIGYSQQIIGLMEKFGLLDTGSTGVHVFVKVFKQFKNLIGSYYAIILQEGLKNCQREDKSMEKAAEQINDIIATTIEDLIAKVEHGEDLEQASGKKEAFVNLIQGLNTNTGSLSSGQMIIMAMNALLDNVDNALMKDEDPNIKLASYLSRFEALRDFFALCFKSMNSFKADDMGQLFPSSDEMVNWLFSKMYFKLTILNFFRAYLLLTTWPSTTCVISKAVSIASLKKLCP